MPSDYTCPRCTSARLKRISLPHPLLLHWVINPGLAFNELVLGQRVPKLSLECQECNLPLIERSLVPCPHCGVVHDARIWSGKNGFGNWLGPVCPSCTRRIPALWGVTSLAVLALTSPIWYLPYRYYFRDRVVQGPGTAIPTDRTASVRNSVKMGLSFGSIMFVALSLAPNMLHYQRTGIWDTHRLLVELLIMVLGGVFFGSSMHWYLNRRARQTGPK